MDEEKIVKILSMTMKKYFEEIVQPYVCQCVFGEAKALLQVEKNLLDVDDNLKRQTLEVCIAGLEKELEKYKIKENK